MKRFPLVLAICSGLCSLVLASQAQVLKGPPRVRDVAAPGMWFPADQAALSDMVDGFLKKVPDQDISGKPVAIISPHAGFQYSGQVGAYSYKVLGTTKARRVIVLAPTHYEYLHGAYITDVDVYRTPLGDVPLDRGACVTLLGSPLVHSLAAERDTREHSVQNQLPFLQRTLTQFSIVPLVIGELEGNDYETLAGLLRPLLDDNTIIVVSSDFTHYGARFDFQPFKDNLGENIRKLDMGAVDRIVPLDFEGFQGYVGRTGATICGRVPIALMLKTLAGRKDLEGKLLKYARSGDATGEYDGSVSYVSLVISQKGVKTVTGAADEKYLSRDEEKTLLRLARQTVKLYLNERKVLDPGKDPEYTLTDKLKADGAAFVTLTKEGQLRGCIGHLVGIESLYKSVIHNAVSAATEDPRFPPMSAAEEKDVHIEISVMSPLKTITDVNEIQVGKHGIVISKGFNRGLLLPQVATEYGWSRTEFLQQTCRKAGLPRDAWQQGATIQIFSAQVFGE